MRRLFRLGSILLICKTLMSYGNYNNNYDPFHSDVKIEEYSNGNLINSYQGIEELYNNQINEHEIICNHIVNKQSEISNQFTTDETSDNYNDFNRCLKNDVELDIGILIDSAYSKRYNNNKNSILYSVYELLSYVNRYYIKQLGIYLRIKHIALSYGNNKWDNEGCKEGLDDIFNEKILPMKPLSNQALWHVLTDCDANVGIAGIATGGLNCLGNAKSITSTYNRYGPWEVIAHEIGHNLGSDHQRGIMSSGDFNFYKGRVQFDNASTLMMCEKIRRIYTRKCTTFLRDVNRECGNGILEVGEECECKKRSQFCKKCKLRKKYDCDSNGGNQCCNNEDGTFKDSSNACILFNRIGYCHRGLCYLTYCDRRDEEFCGLENSCIYKCRNKKDGQCKVETDRIFYKGKIYNHFPDGTLCNNNEGICENGICKQIVQEKKWKDLKFKKLNDKTNSLISNKWVTIQTNHDKINYDMYHKFKLKLSSIGIEREEFSFKFHKSKSTITNICIIGGNMFLRINPEPEYLIVDENINRRNSKIISKYNTLEHENCIKFKHDVQEYTLKVENGDIENKIDLLVAIKEY